MKSNKGRTALGQRPRRLWLTPTPGDPGTGRRIGGAHRFGLAGRRPAGVAPRRRITVLSRSKSPQVRRGIRIRRGTLPAPLGFAPRRERVGGVSCARCRGYRACRHERSAGSGTSGEPRRPVTGRPRTEPRTVSGHDRVELRSQPDRIATYQVGEPIADRRAERAVRHRGSPPACSNPGHPSLHIFYSAE
jgi:hypothetical protein